MRDVTFLPVGTWLSSRQYCIEKHLGSGGFGKTYLVRSRLGKYMVVKEFFISTMCTRDNSNNVTISVDVNRKTFGEQRKKFEDEALLINSLNHPNIVKVSAIFEENNTIYYVMEYVKGESLGDKLCRGCHFDEQQIKRYLYQLLDALEYIHSLTPNALIHLDIKPENILIDKNNNVVLIDFGASKLFNSQSVNKTLMSSNRPPYTLGYAPLEQENGDVEDIGPHCDIYALGATLYKLFTLKNPPMPYKVMSKGLPEIPQASPLMQKVIKKAMAAYIDDRIQSVAEFRYELGDVRTVSFEKKDNEKTSVTIHTKVNSQTQSQSTSRTIINKDKTDVGDHTKLNDETQPQSTRQTVKTGDKTEELNDQIELGGLDEEIRLAMENAKKQYVLRLLEGIKQRKQSPVNNGEKTRVVARSPMNVNNGEKTRVVARSPMNVYNGEKTRVDVPRVRVRREKSITEVVNGVTFKMIAVKGGSFIMGAQSDNTNDFNYDIETKQNESPAHEVVLDDFYLSEFVVTEELWDAVMVKDKRTFLNKLFGKEIIRSKSKLPKIKISWFDCQDFILELNKITGKNFRLPTEAEWEYAARGGNKSNGYKYSGSNTIGDVAWYNGNSSSGTHPVGSKSPNELGLYDMSGNVREWCSDWYGKYSSSPQSNPTGPTSGSARVLRGGSWNYDAHRCRVSDRSNNLPGSRGNRNGFRLALRP